MFDLSHFFCFPSSLICFSYPLSFEYWLRVFFSCGFVCCLTHLYAVFSLIFEICFHHHAAYKKLTLANLLSFFLLHLVVCFAVCFVWFFYYKVKHIPHCFTFLLYFTMFCSLECNFLFLLLICFDEGISNKTIFYHFFKWYFSAFAGRMFSFRLVCSLAIYD